MICAHVAVEALGRHRSAQAAERLAAGDAWVDHDLVFADRAGGFVESQNLLRREFYPLLDRAGLPRIRFHDLRHTAATRMLAQGVHPRIAADVLGHASPSLILDRYGHAIEAMHRPAAQAMDTLLRPGRPLPPSADVREEARSSVGVAATLAATGGSVFKKPVPPAGIEPATRGLGNRVGRDRDVAMAK